MLLLICENVPRAEGILEDHELKLFFLNEWKQLPDDEKGWFK